MNSNLSRMNTKCCGPEVRQTENIVKRNADCSTSQFRASIELQNGYAIKTPDQSRVPTISERTANLETYAVVRIDQLTDL
jgi:hypothetical protein